MHFGRMGTAPAERWKISAGQLCGANGFEGLYTHHSGQYGYFLTAHACACIAQGAPVCSCSMHINLRLKALEEHQHNQRRFLLPQRMRVNETDLDLVVDQLDDPTARTTNSAVLYFTARRPLTPLLHTCSGGGGS
jgi:hypothetical protein